MTNETPSFPMGSDPNPHTDPHLISVEWRGQSLTLETHPKLFSPQGLDRGTLAMLEQTTFTPEDKILDLGCGYGVVGLLAANWVPPSRVFLLDSDPTAVEYATSNAVRNQKEQVTVVQSHGFEQLEETGFTQILSNPPYHADFNVPKHFLEKGFNRLVIGGKFYMVTKRRDWYKNKFIALFGGVTIRETDDYFVFIGEKRQSQYANTRQRRR